MVVTERIGCGGNANSGLGGRVGRGEGGYGWNGDIDILSWWEDNVANITLGTDTNAPLIYAPRLEHHHPIMSTLWDPGGRL